MNTNITTNTSDITTLKSKAISNAEQNIAFDGNGIGYITFSYDVYLLSAAVVALSANTGGCVITRVGGYTSYQIYCIGVRNETKDVDLLYVKK